MIGSQVFSITIAFANLSSPVVSRSAQEELPPAVFTWWGGLLVLLGAILLVWLLITWNAHQTLEYPIHAAHDLEHAPAEAHEEELPEEQQIEVMTAPHE